VVGQVADKELDLVLADLAPRADPLVERRDREEGPDAELRLPLALGEVFQDGHPMARPGERHGGGPPEVAVATENQDSLGHDPLPPTRQGPRLTALLADAGSLASAVRGSRMLRSRRC